MTIIPSIVLLERLTSRSHSADIVVAIGGTTISGVARSKGGGPAARSRRTEGPRNGLGSRCHEAKRSEAAQPEKAVAFCFENAWRYKVSSSLAMRTNFGEFIKSIVCFLLLCYLNQVFRFMGHTNISAESDCTVFHTDYTVPALDVSDLHMSYG